MSELDKNALLKGVKDAFEHELASVWKAASERQVDAGGPIAWEDVAVCVLPLDRIGAPKGASGARVFVVYMSDTRSNLDDERLPISRPLVIKLGPHDDLSTEMEVKKSWPELDDNFEARFAKPFRLVQCDEGTSVLIAPFRSNYQSLPNGTETEVKLTDLWGNLHHACEQLSASGSEQDTHWDKCGSLVHNCIETMHEVHKNHFSSPKRQTVEVGSAFKRYLRKVCDEDGRRHIARRVFGNDARVSAFGRDWSNPIMVADRLIAEGKKTTLAVGPVHGDLHPKNIVLGRQGAVNIIDFGWASKSAPVALDYALLDINLRSITLPSQMSQSDISAFGTFIHPTQNVASLPEIIRPRASIIARELWGSYQTNAKVEDWDAEYMTPLFLIALGLLAHLDDARNQPALLATIFALADHLDGNEVTS
ncbi:phosphotransferase family protein [Hyphomonas oceanitis]|nr:phosphotransferase [Hyphomonas oceanitis]